MLDRPDVARRFDEASVRRVTVLAAPPGFGKSAAIEARLQSRHGSFVRYGLRRADASLAPFVRSLAAAFADTLPGVLATLSTAYDRAMKTARPGHELGVWLAAHLGAVPRTVVLDDLHYGEGDAAIAALVASAVERTGPDVRWILAVRSVEPFHVFELGFEGIQTSSRHKAGLALRFPRILRWRKDKPAAEADTLQTLSGMLHGPA